MLRLKLFFAAICLITSGFLLHDWLETRWSADHPAIAAADASSAQAPSAVNSPAASARGLEFHRDYLSLTASLLGLTIFGFIGLAMFRGNRKSALQALSGTSADPAVTPDDKTDHQPHSAALLQNPFDSDYDGMPFEKRLDIALEATLMHGQHAAVIFFPLRGSFRSLAVDISDRLRSLLPAHGGVEVADDGVIIALAYMKQAGQAPALCARLAEALNHYVRDVPGLELGEPGIALHPLAGYSAAELLAAARENSLALAQSA